MITYELIVTFEMCRAAPLFGFSNITSFEEISDVPIAFKRKKQSKFNSGVGGRISVCCNEGQVKNPTFETFIQRLTLTFIYGNKEVSNKNVKERPCFSTEGSWEITIFTPLA